MNGMVWNTTADWLAGYCAPWDGREICARPFWVRASGRAWRCATQGHVLVAVADHAPGGKPIAGWHSERRVAGWLEAPGRARFEADFGALRSWVGLPSSERCWECGGWGNVFGMDCVLCGGWGMGGILLRRGLIAGVVVNRELLARAMVHLPAEPVTVWVDRGFRLTARPRTAWETQRSAVVLVARTWWIVLMPLAEDPAEPMPHCPLRLAP